MIKLTAAQVLEVTDSMAEISSQSLSSSEEGPIDVLNEDEDHYSFYELSWPAVRSEEHKPCLDEHGSQLPIRREISLNLDRAAELCDKQAAPLIKIVTNKQRRRVSS